jgi:hypothetical protein
VQFLRRDHERRSGRISRISRLRSGHAIGRSSRLIAYAHLAPSVARTSPLPPLAPRAGSALRIEDLGGKPSGVSSGRYLLQVHQLAVLLARAMKCAVVQRHPAPNRRSRPVSLPGEFSVWATAITKSRAVRSKLARAPRSRVVRKFPFGLMRCSATEGRQRVLDQLSLYARDPGHTGADELCAHSARAQTHELY